jgi:hypothetical protein
MGLFSALSIITTGVKVIDLASKGFSKLTKRKHIKEDDEIFESVAQAAESDAVPLGFRLLLQAIPDQVENYAKQAPECIDIAINFIDELRPKLVKARELAQKVEDNINKAQ